MTDFIGMTDLIDITHIERMGPHEQQLLFEHQWKLWQSLILVFAATKADCDSVAEQNRVRLRCCRQREI
jgi:hypothetical protein